MKVELLLTYSLMGTNHHHGVLQPRRLSRAQLKEVLRGWRGASSPGLLSAAGIRATEKATGKKGNANVKGS